MGSLLSRAASINRRDAALARVEQGADPAWMRQAEAAVLEVSKAKAEFTTDDVWATGLEKPREPRALGAVMRSLMSSGIIQPTGHFRRTIQASRHRAPVAVWARGDVEAPAQPIQASPS